MSHRFDTRAIHAGQPDDATTGAVAVPVYQTSTFAQAEPGVHQGYAYARSENPTRSALEANLAALEDARFGLAFASGLAAVNNVLNLLEAGDHVVSCTDLYGGSYRLFTKLYARLGITFTFVDTTDLAAVERAFRPRTRLLWLESPSNPLLRVTDLAACAGLAHSRGVLAVADNTFATPVLQQPLALGADYVVHSTTKYLGGHSDVVGGAVIGKAELLQPVRFYQNAAGGTPGPFDSWLVLRGIKTLAVRMDGHCGNARQLADWLGRHPAVQKVYYPGLSSHPGHELAKKQMRDFGGMISLSVRGGKDGALKLLTNTKLFSLAESLGGVESLICHPATMTHASIPAEVRLARGIDDGLVRLSVGIEEIADLQEDLRSALV